MARSDTASATALARGVPLAVERDHQVLHDLLDRPAQAHAQGAPTGLFQIDHLRTPGDFAGKVFSFRVTSSRECTPAVA